MSTVRTVANTIMSRASKSLKGLKWKELKLPQINSKVLIEVVARISISTESIRRRTLDSLCLSYKKLSCRKCQRNCLRVSFQLVPGHLHHFVIILRVLLLFSTCQRHGEHFVARLRSLAVPPHYNSAIQFNDFRLAF